MNFEPKPETFILKFIILGDSTVGKTALLHRYIHGDFASNGLNVFFFLRK